ncbi:MAG: hypothetical protein LBM23_00520 [Propionibacteriaceae bacterium]|jgi:hypothetical protein|nr:hypothetical protein [Propionibacteriaceae bacterium]
MGHNSSPAQSINSGDENSDKGLLEGFVLDEVGDPLEGCAIDRRGGVDPEIDVHTDSAGFFSHSLAVGTWEIEAFCWFDGTQHRSGLYPVDIIGGEATLITIVVDDE